jgi:uncharacterized Zn finger protein (UPF0148 family)
MTTIKDIFCQFGAEYLQRHAEHIPNQHRKVIQAIMQCRSGQFGVTLYHCQRCGEHHLVNRSCGNRHCPNCQHHKTQQWLAKQTARALAAPYFLITFTVPEQVRDFIRSNQKAAYNAMFEASSQALKLLAKDQRFIGTDLPGFFGILHSWGRQLQYHPHIHYIVPGGGVSKDRTRWLPSRQQFYVPVKALSRIYRAKFRHAMKKAGLLDRIDSKLWSAGWNVNSQAVGQSDTSLKYLAPYVFKVAISDNRMVTVENRTVTFRYRQHGSNLYRTTSLDVLEFIRRFLQHVLPHGFVKVRHYGFLAANCALPIDAIQNFIAKHSGVRILQTLLKPPPPPTPHCPNCGGPLIPLYSIRPTSNGQPPFIPSETPAFNNSG